MERKSFERVVDEAITCDDNKKKANYFNLIEKRCDRLFESSSEDKFLKNVRILKRKAEYYPELTQVYGNIVDNYKDKYAKYREKGEIRHAKVQ